MVDSRCLHYRVNVFLWALIKYQIMSHVFNFLFEILLILTHDLGSTDQTINDSAFHVMWVVELEVQYICGIFSWPIYDPSL
jgi:hypothetical protein